MDALPPPWSAAGGSIQGPRRSSNQDTYVVCAKGAGVFDGVGGLPRGAEAAQAAAARAPAALQTADPVSLLQEAVRATGGSTTAVLVRWSPPEAWSVGDSWLLHAGPGGALRPMASDGVGNVLLQCLGPDEARPHHVTLDTQPGDRLVLCTDGVHRVMTPDEIAAITQAESPEHAVQRILDTVAARGAPDNATVVVARYDRGS